MNDIITTLALVSIFHILGGVAVGSSLRGLRNGFSGNKIFFLIWGTGFGCLPLSIGAQTFPKAGAPYLFGIEIFVLMSAILGAALMPDWVLESYNWSDLSPIGFGGLFLFIGLIAGGVMLKTEPIGALVFGCAFGGTGALIFFLGLRSLLRR